jgi:hypothetical protein
MKAVSTAASGIRHLVGMSLQALVIVAIIAALVVAASVLTNTQPSGASNVLAAGHRSNSTTTAITIPDSVFGGTSDATTGASKWVYVECSQGGQVVFEQYKQADSTGSVVLGYFGPTSMWTGGSATCVGQEGYWSRNGRWRGIASTNFYVAG